MTLLLEPPTTAGRDRFGREDAVETLRARIERADYEVDADKVAAAIVARLLRG